MATCPICGVEQTPTQYCVVDGDLHATFGSHFINPGKD